LSRRRISRTERTWKNIVGKKKTAGLERMPAVLLDLSGMSGEVYFKQALKSHRS
jgi:hypothetical protein